MTSSTLTVTDFLLARIAEDEAAARRSMSPAPWIVDGTSVVMRQGSTDTTIVNDWQASDGDLAHIARQSPARVLAECEAKRRIVGECGDVIDMERTSEEDPRYAWTAGLARRTLWSLAFPYSDHPDFDDQWWP